jgi:hypothetical protein
MRTKQFSWMIAAVGAVVVLPAVALAQAPVAYTVPWDPKNITAPHVTYPGRSVHLKGTYSAVSGDTITATWNPGDGSAVIGPFTPTSQYDASTLFTYNDTPSATIYNATLTINDTTNGTSASATYPVIVEANNASPPPQIDVAIDEGLWYLHTMMNRYNNSPGTSDGLHYGDWTVCFAGDVACDGYVAVSATNTQAFEVNGHLQNGPATDPYTDDVLRGMNSIVNLWLTTEAIPATRTISGVGTYTVDQVGNLTGIYCFQQYFNYQSGQLMDAIVATATPNQVVASVAPVGIAGLTYGQIVQEMVDDYVSGMWYADNTSGGAWYYYSNSGCGGNAGCSNDNSASQWAAIGIIAAVRGFGSKVDPVALTWNSDWIVKNEGQNGNTGEMGYRDGGGGSNGLPLWGPFADTPSGLVQLAMDGIGRGNSLWDLAECYMFDNFENSPAGGAGSSLQAYTYGMYSFTKAMLLHDPGGNLEPISTLGQNCANPPFAPIDWYGDPTYGVAARLVALQNPAGYWYGNNYNGAQFPLETASSIIMLNKTIITVCVQNLKGVGKPKGTSPASVTLVWSSIPNISKYNVLRGNAHLGPYTQIGTTTSTFFVDNVGLKNNETYYYVLQPQTLGGTEACQSNEAAVKIPKSR